MCATIIANFVSFIEILPNPTVAQVTEIHDVPLLKDNNGYNPFTTIHIDNESYTITGLIGYGEFGKVFKVRDDNGSIFALKENWVFLGVFTEDNRAKYAQREQKIHEFLLSNHNNNVIRIWQQVIEKVGWYQSWLSQLYDEIHIEVGQLACDINLSHLHPKENLDIYRCLMDFVPEDLDGWLCKFPRRVDSLDDTVTRKKIAREVLLGLNFLHSNQILHGDLKPKNILIDCPNLLDVRKVQITDFSLAISLKNAEQRLFPQIESDHPTGIVSQFYTATGQERGSGRYAEAADIYSFGVILLDIFLITDRTDPFEATEVLRKELVLVDQEGIFSSSHELDDRLVDLLKRLLQRFIEMRPALDDLVKERNYLSD